MAADALFIGGAVLGVGAAILLFTTHWKSETTTPAPVSLAPWLGPGAGGIGAHGSF